MAKRLQNNASIINMKKVIIGIVILACMLLSATGCATFSYSPHYDKVYYWVYSNDNTYFVKIIFHSNRTFEIQEHLSELSLMKSPLTQTGTWYQKKDLVYLTTDYQNKMSDYLDKVGPSPIKGHIELHLRSLYDNQPVRDFVFFVDNKMHHTDSAGGIIIPNSTCQNAAIQVGLLINSPNSPDRFFDVKLDSNMSYVVFVNDCLMSVMSEVPFKVMEDCLMEINNGHRFEIIDVMNSN